MESGDAARMDEQFGPFRLLARLGRGGMAETFVAERAGPADFVQRVCLKRVLSEHSANPDFVRAFQNEARLAALLQHPNIVSVLDFGCEREAWWMSLELVEGLDLRRLIRGLASEGKRLPLEVTLYITAELAKALGYAHERRFTDGAAAGIVHRDVSPSNVLVSHDGAVKLADFGIAKATQAVDKLKTESGFVKGKAPYMAPEQALGLDVDRRADLFALGVIVFELLAGVRPYDGATDLATLKNITEGRSKSLEELAPDVPGPLVELVEGLIDPKRGSRTSSAAEVLDALAALPSPSPKIARVVGELARRVSPPELIPSQGALTQRAPTEPPTAPGKLRGSVVNAAEGTPPTPLTTASAPRPAERRSFALAAASVVTLGIASAVGLRWASWAGDPAEPSPSSVSVTVASSGSDAGFQAPSPAPSDGGPIEGGASAVDAALADAGLDAGSRRRPRAEVSRPQEASATLRVIVHPVGRVVIDGRDLGESPVEHALPAGRHVVEGVRGLERARRVVELEVGERVEVVLRP